MMRSSVERSAQGDGVDLGALVIGLPVSNRTRWSARALDHAQTREQSPPAKVGAFASLSRARERSGRRVREGSQASYPPGHAWAGPVRLGPRSGTGARSQTSPSLLTA